MALPTKLLNLIFLTEKKKSYSCQRPNDFKIFVGRKKKLAIFFSQL